jgi:hypothetical protein
MEKEIGIKKQEGRFSNSFEHAVRPKKSDIGCYSPCSFTQPCHFFSNKFLKNMAKW